MKDKVAIIIDDLIASGTTIVRTVNACQTRGANEIYTAAPHGMFVGNANDTVARFFSDSA